MALFKLIPKDNPHQELRLRRLMMATISSLIILSFLGALHINGYATLEGLQWSATGIVTCCVVFYALIRSGLNLKFSDPSLTAPQMVSAFFVITVSAYYTHNDARSTLLPVLLMIFYFGVFRLDSWAMTTLALINSAFYGAMVWLLTVHRPDAVNVNLEFMRWWILTVVSLWFGLVGGHVSRLRSELASRKEAIEALLERDDLTGAGNRRFLMHMLEQEKSRADRTGTSFSLAMLDLDHFKKINDTYGHQAGDRMLKTFVQIAHAELRKIDYFGRYGGEEFMLIMADTHLDGAVIKAERLREALEQSRHPEIDAKLVQTVSIGIAEYRKGETIEQLQLRADKVMYKAKAKGRNRVETDAVPLDTPRYMMSSMR